MLVYHYILNKVLEKIKMIKDTETFDNTKILIETDDKFAEDITLKNVVMLISFVIKGNDKFYTQLFLEKTSILQDQQEVV